MSDTVPTSERMLPSRARRVVIILLYELVLFVLFVFLCNAMVSESCSTESVCSLAERTTVKVIVYGWIAAVAWAFVYGWRGRLIGARGASDSKR